MDAQKPKEGNEQRNEAQIIRERFYFFAKEYEVFPIDFLKSRYFEGTIPLEFLRGFEFFVENEVMRTLKHFLREFGHNRELFREKYGHYVFDLFQEQKRRMRDGVLFGNFDLSAGSNDVGLSPVIKGEIEQFLVRYRESLLLVLNFATAPDAELELAPLSDQGERQMEYMRILERVGVKTRKLLD